MSDEESVKLLSPLKRDYTFSFGMLIHGSRLRNGLRRPWGFVNTDLNMKN